MSAPTPSREGGEDRGGGSGTELPPTPRLPMLRATRPRPFVFLVLLALLSGCGYQLSGQAGTIPQPLQRIAVPMFTNTTEVPGLERLVTSAVRTQLQRDGRARLETEASATALLRGEVKNYHLQVLATDSSDFVLEYRVAVDVRMIVEDRQQHQTILDETVGVTSEYVVSSQIVPTDIARDRALLAVARDAGERVVGLLLDRF